MGRSVEYALDYLVLELDCEFEAPDLDRVLLELSWVRLMSGSQSPALYIRVSSNDGLFEIPRHSRQILHTDDFQGFESADDFYLTDGRSVFHLRASDGRGDARLSSSFFAKPPLARANFWCFGLLKLLRAKSTFSLHAAGLATADGTGVLLAGASGSGKSTLAIGLIRQGWKYLSDDAVLIRLVSQSVEALAGRRSFYIDALRSEDYADLPLGENIPDVHGRDRRRVLVDQAYPEQRIGSCFPRILIFPRIEDQPRSIVRRVDRIRALHLLLCQSAPQLLARSNMAQHLEALKTLIRQTDAYELSAGLDLYQTPAKLIDLIGELQDHNQCRASLSN